MTTFGVIGKPILHSLSPVIHQAAFRALGIDNYYIRLCVDSAEGAVSLAKEIGISGLNITAPFKEEGYKLANISDDASHKLESSNTLVFKDNSIFSYNTDIYGVRQSIINKCKNIEGKKGLVIGSGGAGRAGALALLGLGAEVTITNRTIEKGKKIANDLRCQFCPLNIEALSNILPSINIILSTAPVSDQTFPLNCITSEHIILDAIYKEITPLVQTAKQTNSTIINGKDWLIHQALKAFEIFNDQPCTYETMQTALTLTKRIKPKILSLIGMMGSGKSTLGEMLARKLSLPFYDLDKEFEKECGQSVGDYIRKVGESDFREKESAILKRYLTKERGVIACGGGVVLSKDNRELLKANSLPIFLWSSINTLVSRVSGDKNRPLLDGGDIKEKVTALLEKRKDLYIDTSEMIISTDVTDGEKITDRILYEINSTWAS